MTRKLVIDLVIVTIKYSKCTQFPISTPPKTKNYDVSAPNNKCPICHAQERTNYDTDHV